MKWIKQGLVFTAEGQFPWLSTHAANPVVMPLGKDRVRVYFSSHDGINRSHIGCVDLNVLSPTKSQNLFDYPVLTPGPLGFFDDNGVAASSLVDKDGIFYLFYTGINAGPSPLFYSSIGLAVSDDLGRTFRRISDAPILSRSDHDPWMVNHPFVLLDNGVWRMWYVSGFKWEETEHGYNSSQDIKYAESKDGINWSRDGLVCIPHCEGEKNIARPCVLKEGNLYRMWYSVEGISGYRISYAESNDGLIWERKNELGLDISDSGWDSQSVDAPYVIFTSGSYYMFYNGNRSGYDGFGLAVAA